MKSFSTRIFNRGRDIGRLLGLHSSDSADTIKIRMTAVEIESHLKRLYPQIGFLVCDLVRDDERSLLSNEDLKERVELALRYERSLKKIKTELAGNVFNRRQEVHSDREKDRA